MFMCARANPHLSGRLSILDCRFCILHQHKQRVSTSSISHHGNILSVITTHHPSIPQTGKRRRCRRNEDGSSIINRRPTFLLHTHPLKSHHTRHLQPQPMGPRFRRQRPTHPHLLPTCQGSKRRISPWT